MSKPIQAINRYKADLRELNFLLFEQFRIGDLLGKAPFDAWGPEECKTTLTECYRWVREVIGPLNAVADAEGCKVEGGRVITPTGFKAAWKSLYEAGWKAIAVDPEHGGAGAPHSLQVMVEEMISGANTAFAMYSGLAFGAAEAFELRLQSFGVPVSSYVVQMVPYLIALAVLAGLGRTSRMPASIGQPLSWDQ